MRKNKGFTLIELLVVIAIIGILSSIVLVSMNSTRAKAKDARITASLAQVRALAEVNYDGAIYSATTFITPTQNVAGCTVVAGVDNNLYLLAADIISQLGVSTCVAAYAVGDTGQLAINKCSTNAQYGATVKMASGSLYSCVDYTGASKQNYISRAAALTDANDCACN